MRRPARWTLNAMTVLSLLMCVGTALLWASHWSWDGYLFHYGIAPPVPLPPKLQEAATLLTSERSVTRIGIVEIRRQWWLTSQGARLSRVIIVKPWTVILICGILPYLWLRQRSHQWLQDRRARFGRCANCGYDLTANTSGVCPECGTSVAKAPSPPAESFR